MKGVLEIEQKPSVFGGGVVFMWTIYIDSLDAPWIEDGTGYPLQKDAIRVGRKWARKLSIKVELFVREQSR